MCLLTTNEPYVGISAISYAVTSLDKQRERLQETTTLHGRLGLSYEIIGVFDHSLYFICGS